MELKGSKTEKNLMDAFAGESQARNKYTYFASKARKDGFEQIAAIFEETANNEKEHAKLWFKLLNGGEVPSTEENLKAAAAGENYEYTDMYKRMAEEAREEGFDRIAYLFDAVGKIEEEHEKRYLALLDNVKEEAVFSRDSTFCNVKPECVIENLTMPSLYQCPLMLHTGGLDDVVVKQLHLDVPPADLTEWKEMLARIATRSKTCTIALVGKYVKLHDAYLSVMESLYHAGFENDSQVEIKWVESEDLPDQAACREAFADVDGIIVPGGFGDRGIEGMIQAAQYARENDVPYFGICLGMQIMVMEFARHVLGYADANSSEFTPQGHHNVIDLMADQQGNIPKGGTMRLGKYPCTVLPGTKMAECYGQSEIWVIVHSWRQLV